MEIIKKIIVFLLTVLILVFSFACGVSDNSNTPILNITDEQKEKEGQEVMENTFLITVNKTTFTADFANNSSAEALKSLLEENDIIIELHDYGNFEKVGSLGSSLPTNDERITTEAGDVILYQGNQITIYYDTNSWNFTRLGKIRNATKTDLLKVLGDKDVTVTLSLN